MTPNTSQHQTISFLEFLVADVALPDSFHHVRSKHKVVHLLLNVLSQVLQLENCVSIALTSKMPSKCTVLQAMFNILQEQKNMLGYAVRDSPIQTAKKMRPQPRPAAVSPDIQRESAGVNSGWKAKKQVLLQAVSKPFLAMSVLPLKICLSDVLTVHKSPRRDQMSCLGQQAACKARIHLQRQAASWWSAATWHMYHRTNFSGMPYRSWGPYLDCITAGLQWRKNVWPWYRTSTRLGLGGCRLLLTMLSSEGSAKQMCSLAAFWGSNWWACVDTIRRVSGELCAIFPEQVHFRQSGFQFSSFSCFISALSALFNARHCGHPVDWHQCIVFSLNSDTTQVRWKVALKVFLNMSLILHGINHVLVGRTAGSLRTHASTKTDADDFFLLQNLPAIGCCHRPSGWSLLSYYPCCLVFWCGFKTMSSFGNWR